MTARNDLVRLLRLIFSAERGAALAYRGHAASLRNPDERARVATIRLEELDHRQRVGAILADLHARPARLLELTNLCIGAAIGAFCRVGGWYLPMYGAGWLERRNITDYERAARLALECAAPAYAADLLDLAEAEWEHERFFREKAASHWLSHLLPVWTAPGPKSAIRQGVSSAPAPGRTSLRAQRHRLLL
jgi:rubrerythrin